MLLFLLSRSVAVYLMQLLLCSKAQTVDSVGPAVRPLTELLGRLSKRHAGCNSAINNCLEIQRSESAGFKVLNLS